MNAKQSRDRSVDELLRQALIGTPTTQASEACLDAETLAAWVDGGLDARAAALAETHAASCGRCQSLVAAMVRTAPEAALRTPWWQRDWGVRWVVPLTATAAAVLLWTIVPDRPTGSPVSDQVSFQSRPAALPPPPPPSPAVETAPPTRPLAQSSAEAKREAPTSPLARERDASARGAVVGQRAQTEPRAEVTAPPSPSRVPAPSAPAVGAAAAGARAAETRDAAKDTIDTRDSLRARGALNQRLSVEILSPNAAVRWRIDPGGSVYFSTDAGSTWELVSTGTSADLISGSSPSPSVCWLVGRGGVVLRTTDGRRWERVVFPEPVDLASVQATDAETAVVTTSDGRTFRTADGGRTWGRAPPQGF